MSDITIITPARTGRSVVKNTPDGPNISDPAYLSCFEGFAVGYMVAALDYVSSEHYSTCGEEPEPSERDSEYKTKCKPSEPIPPLNRVSRVRDIMRRESRLCTRPAQPTEGLSANGWTSHDLTSPKPMLERASERRAQSGNLRIEGQSQG